MTTLRLLPSAVLAGLLCVAPIRAADIELIGKAGIPGNARDRSGLKDRLKDGTPHDQLGSLGSAFAYTGQEERYVLLADRGPGDGVTRWFCRFHTFSISVDAKARTVTPVLLSTTLLTNEKGQNLVGLASEFDKSNSPAGLRFDPEGVRVGRTGALYVADEYGPFLCEFAADGRRKQVFAIPPKFLIDKPGTAPEDEQPPHNTAGRAANRGFEGLAIAPDGGKLYALLQSPLLQDRVGAKSLRAGQNVRLLELPLKGKPREFVYPLESAAYGLNEIVAVSGHQFLVIERDHREGKEARFKKLMLADLEGATDVSDVAALPEKGLPSQVKPLAKKVFLDLLNPDFGLAGPMFPGKVEGLAFGPLLPDGRILLLVTTDNDCKAEEPTWIWAFAIERRALPGYVPQAFDRK